MIYFIMFIIPSSKNAEKNEIKEAWVRGDKFQLALNFDTAGIPQGS